LFEIHSDLIIFCESLRLHTMHATMITAEYVLGALDFDAWSKHRSKQLQLSRTEALASICRGADWTVVLNQQITTVLGFFDLSHITFFSPHLREFLKFFRQRISGPNAFCVIRFLTRTT